MQRAKFSGNLADQIESFRTLGYVLIRAGKSSVKSRADLVDAHKYIIKHLHNEQSTWRYKFWRVLNKVATSELRHTLPLPLTTIIRNVLDKTIGDARPFLDSQLALNSELVELNSLISLPGSQQQDVHADIPFSEDNMLISGFIALGDVNMEDGPTHMFNGSHTRAYHRRMPTEPLDVYYSSDGSSEVVVDTAVAVETAAETEALDSLMAAPACYAQLCAGDVLLFNTMLFHYGGANRSALPRALLSFSFQRNAACGSMRPINGFTYHCHDTVQGQYSLQSFPHSFYAASDTVSGATLVGEVDCRDIAKGSKSGNVPVGA